jgi:hypothetical protein
MFYWLGRRIKNPKGIIVDYPQGQQPRRAFAIGDASGNERCINSGSWVLEQLKIFDRSSGLSQFQINAITREPASVSPAVIIEGGAFERRCKGYRRWRRRKKINE